MRTLRTSETNVGFMSRIRKKYGIFCAVYRFHIDVKFKLTNIMSISINLRLTKTNALRIHPALS